MSQARRRLLLTWAVAHLVLIALVCLHETFWLITHGFTVLEARSAPGLAVNESVVGAILGDHLSSANVYRRALLTYANSAGIEIGYGYFAPNVPATSALLFECRYTDGHVELKTLKVGSEEAALRTTTLVEQIGRTDFKPWRDALVKRLALAVGRETVGVTHVRAVLLTVAPPSLKEFREGERDEKLTLVDAADFEIMKLRRNTRPP